MSGELAYMANFIGYLLNSVVPEDHDLAHVLEAAVMRDEAAEAGRKPWSWASLPGLPRRYGESRFYMFEERFLRHWLVSEVK